GFKWIELEDASIEVIESFVAELIRQMEGYANAGFEYLQEKWENENMIFRNPFVFVKILEELENNN
ncbi:MAG: hypothetical protein PHO68_09385, partial [Lascolabacillus sp.]|nr:hypothetical protein [Lascolabacillus sp.]